MIRLAGLAGLAALSLIGCGSSTPPASTPAPEPSVRAAAVPAPLHRGEVDRAVNDGLGALLGKADVGPVLRKGTFVGFAVKSFDGDLARVGLEPGDVIVRVGGKPIATPDEAQAAFEALRQVPSVVLDIERAGVPRTLTTPIVP